MILKGNYRPVLASWIINSAAILLSFITYWTSPNHTAIGGSLNIASTATIWSILVATYMKHKGPLTFSPFQQSCLWASLGIAVIWCVVKLVLGGTGFLPNIFTQILMIIAYVVNIQKVWKATTHSEPLFIWWCVLFGSIVAIGTAHLKHDLLAGVYAIRSTVMCGILLFALYRIDWRRKALKA